MATKEWLKHVEVMQTANVQAVGRERHQLLGLRTMTRTLYAGFSFTCNLATCSITYITKEHFQVSDVLLEDPHRPSTAPINTSINSIFLAIFGKLFIDKCTSF